MSDSFVPLMAAPVSSGETALFELKILPQAEAKSVLEPVPDGASLGQPAKPCGRPSVRLLRQGEVVCGIRIECTCGQVIELECVY
jgi:hypothetical protein